MKHINGQELDPGTYDDAAHEGFLQACVSRRERAERKAEVARFLVAMGPGVKWPDRLRLVHAKFGVMGHSQPRLKALLTRLKGVEARFSEETNMAQHLRIANADFRPRRPGDFAHTETAQDILHSLEMLRHRQEPSVAMIAGAPGVGKTKALQSFLSALRHDAFRLEVADGEGRPSGVAYSLLRAFGVQGNGMSLPAMKEALVGYIGRGRMVALDDAHNL
ncbi:AAA family ATPase [Pararhodobacter marinus]|uniref:AAA family ATPase n=1 Tax=Pararhodobacter marinus TaxID=2184063 RepID=UPI0035184C32